MSEKISLDSSVPITYTKRTTSEKYGAKKHFFHTINGQSFSRQIRH